MRIFNIKEYCPKCNRLLDKKHKCPKCKKYIPYEDAIIVEQDEINHNLADFDNLEELI